MAPPIKPMKADLEYFSKIKAMNSTEASVKAHNPFLTVLQVS